MIEEPNTLDEALLLEFLMSALSLYLSSEDLKVVYGTSKENKYKLILHLISVSRVEELKRKCDKLQEGVDNE